MRFGCIKRLNLLVVLGWVGLCQSADGLGWIIIIIIIIIIIMFA